MGCCTYTLIYAHITVFKKMIPRTRITNGCLNFVDYTLNLDLLVRVLVPDPSTANLSTLDNYQVIEMSVQGNYQTVLDSRPPGLEMMAKSNTTLNICCTNILFQ